MERSQLQEMLDNKLVMRDSLNEDLSLKNISLPDYRNSIARFGKVLLEELSGKLSKVAFNEKIGATGTTIIVLSNRGAVEAILPMQFGWKQQGLFV